MIKLGDKVKDKITGFTGIVVAVTKWLNGCNTIGVQIIKLKDGLPQEKQFIDENQLEVIRPKVKIIKPIINEDDEEKTGGPHEIPQRTLSPR